MVIWLEIRWVVKGWKMSVCERMVEEEGDRGVFYSGFVGKEGDLRGWRKSTKNRFPHI